MSAAIGINHLLLCNGLVFYIINFKLLCMSEMLKYIAVFIRNCYLHSFFSLLQHGLPECHAFSFFALFLTMTKF